MYCHLYATYTFIFLICFVIHAQQQHCASVRGHFLDTSLSIVVAAWVIAMDLQLVGVSQQENRGEDLLHSKLNSWGLQDYLDCCPLVANGVITVARGDMKLKITKIYTFKDFMYDI